MGGIEIDRKRARHGAADPAGQAPGGARKIGHAGQRRPGQALGNGHGGGLQAGRGREVALPAADHADVAIFIGRHFAVAPVGHVVEQYPGTARQGAGDGKRRAIADAAVFPAGAWPMSVMIASRLGDRSPSNVPVMIS
jgi:hypothetical protein